MLFWSIGCINCKNFGNNLLHLRIIRRLCAAVCLPLRSLILVTKKYQLIGIYRYCCIAVILYCLPRGQAKVNVLITMENLTLGDKKDFLKGNAVYSNKPHLRCYKCSTVYHYRIKRGWFLKYVLFFLPIKIYFCGRCVKNRYLLLTDKGEARYKPV